MGPRGALVSEDASTPGTPRRLQFQPSSRKGSGSDAGSSGGYYMGSTMDRTGGSGFCDPEAFSDAGSMRSGGLRSARSSPNLAGRQGGMDTTLESPMQGRGPADSFDRRISQGTQDSQTRRTNVFAKNTTVGNLEGYHGVRCERTVTNKRLFGLGPCQRSSVDEVVFGRDFDGSGCKDTNAEIDVLLNMFEGAAGKKDAIAEMLEDVPGTGFRGPDDDHKLCLRSATRIAEMGYDGCAGMKTREPRDMKRAWRRLPMQKSSVAEIVFGQNHSHLSGHEQMFVEQFSRSAGLSPRIRKSQEGSTYDAGAATKNPQPKSNVGKSPSRRRFYQNSSLHSSSIAPLDNLHKAEQQQAEAGALPDLTEHFHGAAGKSPRFAMTDGGRATKLQPGHPVYCVYR